MKAPPTLDFVLELEHKVWQAFVAGDAAADTNLLAEDFLGVYATGFANREEHAAQLLGGPVISSFRLSDARLLVIEADVVLLAYLAEFRRSKSPPGSPPERMYITSLWQRLPEGWRNVFSQDTGAV